MPSQSRQFKYKDSDEWPEPLQDEFRVKWEFKEFSNELLEALANTEAAEICQPRALDELKKRSNLGKILYAL